MQVRTFTFVGWYKYFTTVPYTFYTGKLYILSFIRCSVPNICYNHVSFPHTRNRQTETEHVQAAIVVLVVATEEEDKEDMRNE